MCTAASHGGTGNLCGNICQIAINVAMKRKEPGKRCNRCGEWRPLTEYYSREGSRDGLRRVCKDCVRESSRRYKLIKKIMADYNEKGIL